MNGKREGKGRLVLASGDVMDGWFKDGEFHGEGAKTTAGGYVFSGMWQGGLLSGAGSESARPCPFALSRQRISFAENPPFRA